MRNTYGIFLMLVVLLGCDSEEPAKPKAGENKLDYYVESYDFSDSGFQPQSKVIYEYNSSGKLARYTVSVYFPSSESFKEQQYFEFTYVDQVVSKITGYSAPNAVKPYLEHSYEYFPDGRVSKIKEINLNAAVNSEANFIYDDTHQSTRVAYTFSNGSSFLYEFQLTDGNLVTDRTTRGAQLCSNGQYIYDDHINPFNKFGYIDYLLTNLSANNKRSENINHVGCSFPTLQPAYYSYEYNEDGYPTSITTFYKSGSKSRKEIFYK